MFDGYDLSCVRGDTQLFESLTFSVKKGECLILCGPNGVGKTSLLRMMAGLLPPKAGYIIWDGRNIHYDLTRYREHMIWTGPDVPVREELTVSEHLKFWNGLYNDDAATADISVALDISGLADFANEPAAILSTGQKKRLILSRLFVSFRPLWLLDEPLNGLDDDGRALLQTAISIHRENGGMVIMASHDTGFIDNSAVLHIQNYIPENRALTQSNMEMLQS